ncbi:hypothetical protein RFI_06731 [Reticulomyxa filosa]|uniref:Uncharacterized protein n=1 Tax=Reticulomyxa filosa TaxID=46433 RepID=X6NX13_RETFI|nr:hypothetical protein RFI_06731 [Reticulomyxa filosa]|eukprot:ETO30393.1 hypothetical protein RFI_06731 [Reticulomyxa filosa]
MEKYVENFFCGAFETGAEEKVSLVVYDFDQTITCDHLYHRLEGGMFFVVEKKKTTSVRSVLAYLCVLCCFFKKGQLDELSQLSDEALTEVFGGESRIKRLNLHFERVKSGATIAIVSYGYVSVIEKALERMGLGAHWRGCVIIGCDSQELTRAGGRKAKIIEDLKRKHNLTSNQGDVIKILPPLKKKKLMGNVILFVDDDPTNIRQAGAANCSRTLGISPRSGMTEEHMCEIEKQTRVWTSDSNSNSNSNASTEGLKGHKGGKDNDLAEHGSSDSKEHKSATGDSHDKSQTHGNGIVITSPRTVMDQSSSKNKYDFGSDEHKENHNTKSYRDDGNVNVNSSKSHTSTLVPNANSNATTNTNSNTNTSGGNNTSSTRTDWSKFNVIVPKNVEQIWSRSRENSDSVQDSPVIYIKSNSIDSDDNGPVLGLPPDMPSSNHF